MEHTEKDGISVIIPVYDAQRYLRRAVDSVLAQTYKDIELILVNDGSKDGSLEICREYEKQDDRVVVIDKENGGVSSARNAGIERATMKYVAFMDNDDYMIPTYLEVMHEQISMDGGRDLLIANSFHIMSDEFSVDMDILKDDGRNNLQTIDAPNVDEIKNKFTQIQMRNQIWNMLFVREKLIKSNIRFMNIHGEDVVFSLTYVIKCNSLRAICGYRGYVWVLYSNSQSQSHKYAPDLDYLILFDKIYGLVIEIFKLQDPEIRCYKNSYLHRYSLICLFKLYYKDTCQPKENRLTVMKALTGIIDVEDKELFSKVSCANKLFLSLLKYKCYDLLDFFMRIYVRIKY